MSRRKLGRTLSRQELYWLGKLPSSKHENIDCAHVCPFWDMEYGPQPEGKGTPWCRNTTWPQCPGHSVSLEGYGCSKAPTNCPRRKGQGIRR